MGESPAQITGRDLEFRCVMAVQARDAAKADLIYFGANGGACIWLGLDKEAELCAARNGFEPKRARACEDVGNDGAI